MKQVLRFLALAALICVPWVTQAQTEETVTVAFYPPTEEFATGYTDGTTKTSGDMHCVSAGGVQGWMKFDVSGIPDNATINAITLKFYCTSTSNCWVKLTSAGGLDPATASAADLYTAIITTNPNYYTSTYMSGFSSSGLKSFALSDDAVTNLQTNGLNNDYFTMGFYEYESSSGYILYASGYEDANKPYIEVTYTATVSCSKPSSLTPSNILAHSAILTWAGGSGTYNVQYKKAADAEWTTHLTNTDLLTTTISGLDAQTEYQARVQSVCGDETSNWTSTTFTTECEAISTFPWSTNFDSYTGTTSGGTNNLPLCWNYINNSTSSSYQGYPIIYNSSSDAHSGSNYLRFYSYYGSSFADEYAILPEMDGISGLRMKLYARAYSSSYNATFHVGVMTDPTDATTFVEIGNYTPTTTTYELYTIPFNTYTGSGKYIAIKVEKPTSSYRYVYIDDITVEEIPNCIEPSALAEVPNTATPNSLTFNWTAGGSETTWKLQYKKSSEEEWTTLASPVTTIPYTLEGLDASTVYNVRVAAWCNPSNPEAISSYSEAATATTACEAFTAPWTENFESLTAGTVPICWNNSATTGADYSSNPHYYWGVYEYSSNKMLRMYNFYAHGPNAIINSPTITLPSEGTYQLTFDYSHTASCGAFYVKISTDNGASFVDLQSYTKVGTSSSNSDPGTFTEANPISLVDYAGQSIILQFYAEPNYGSGAIFVDNVSVGLAPTCNKPTGLAKANVAAHQVDLSWTKGDAETAWDICINGDEANPVGIDENDVTITGSSVSYTLTSLVSETPYTVKVRANCGGSNGVSQWSNEVSFTTTVACPAPTSPSVPNSSITAHTAKFTWIGSNATPDYVVSYRTAAYTEGFEENFNTSSIPTGWTRYSGLVDNVVAGTETLTTVSGYWNTNSYALGSYNASLNIYGSSCKYWLVSPEINIESGYSFSFDLALTGYSSSSAASGTCADDRFVVLIYADDAWTILREWNNSGSTYVYNDIATDGEPVNDIDISGYVGKTVKFAFYGESTASGGDNDLHIDNVAVGIAHVAGEWQTVDVDDSGDDTPAAEKTLTGLVAEKKYEAKVKANCTASSDGYSLETSIVTFTTLAGNQKPTDVEVDPVTLSSSTATVSWTGNGCSDHHVSYDVYYATSDVAAVPATPTAPNLITGVTETSKTITGLGAETEYKVWVRDNCGTDGVSDWSAAVTFTTLANCPQPTAVVVSNIGTHVADVEWTGIPEYTVKYRKSAYMDGIEETFGTSLPSGWENKTGLLSDVMGGTALSSSPTQWSFGTSNGVFDQHARINIYGEGSYERKGWLITPTFTLPAGATMSFDLALTAYSGTLGAPATTGTDDRFVVLVYADDAWTILREWNNDDSPYVYNNIANTATGETVDDIDISAYEGKTVKFAFYGESTQSNADNNLHIDNVIIGTPVPAGTWSTIEDVDANSITLTGLDAGTKYDVVIEPECNTTLASDPVSFTTVALPTLDITANSWYAIASPVHNSGNDETVAEVDNLIATSPVEYDFLRYVEASCKWESYKEHTADFDLEQGRGYIYRRSADATLVFDGEPNRGSVNVNITMDADGWNLVGNPYMKTITRNSNFAGSSTAVFTTGGYRLSANGSWTAINNNSDIAVGLQHHRLHGEQ